MRKLYLLFALLLAGCNSITQSSLVTPSLPEAQESATRPELSRTLVARVTRSFGGVYRHPGAEKLLRQTLRDLIEPLGATGLPDDVILLDSPSYNAASLPNGQLFVTRGIVALANDRSELAAALAHELGHVIARHAAQRVVERAVARADTLNIARVTGNSEIVRSAIDAHRLSLAAFSRERELEADRISIALLAKAGFDPHASLRMLQSLDRMANFYAGLARVGRREASPLASHPPTPARIAAVREILKTLPKRGRTDREAFLAAIAGMRFGENGRNGFVRGRAFIHPDLDIAITMPPGYIVRGARSAIAGVKRGGGSVMIFSRLPVSVAGNPQAALTTMLSRISTPAKILPLPGGRNGALAAIDGPNGDTRLAIVTVEGKPYRLILSSAKPDASFETDFTAALASLRTLAADDRRIARPQQIAIRRVDGPSALARFARLAGDEDYGVQMLLALNGLSKSSDMRSGMRFKAVEIDNRPAQSNGTAE